MKSFLFALYRWMILVLIITFTSSAKAQTVSNPQRFEKQVVAFEVSDKTAPPPPNAILLVGDSQFFRWKTVDADLPGYTVVNRAIDGFKMTDLVYYVDRLVPLYKARLIVTNVGGNDIHEGRTPEQVLADFKMFVTAVRAKTPDARIAFSSLTPGPARWPEANSRVKFNAMLKDYVAATPGLIFIDLWAAMLTPEGKPREDIWVADRIHPNHDGYMVRVKIMQPILGKPDKATK